MKHLFALAILCVAGWIFLPGVAARPQTGPAWMAPLYTPHPSMRWEWVSARGAGPDCGPGCVFATDLRFPGPATVDLRATISGHGFVELTAADRGDPVRIDADAGQPLDLREGAVWGPLSNIQVRVRL